MSVSALCLFGWTGERDDSMKKSAVAVFMLMSVAVGPVFAGHDHGGGYEAGGRSYERTSKTEQRSDETEMMLKICTQHLVNIERYLETLQVKIAEKRSSAAALEEIYKLEHHLREAMGTVRALQLF
jgi:hypothetical protein